MPKPINPTIGACPCSFRDCAHAAEVKKEKGKRQRLYLVCPDHGVINVGGQPFQEYILENASMGRGQTPELAPDDPALVPAPISAPISTQANADIERGPAPIAYPKAAGTPAPLKAPPPRQPSPTPKPKAPTPQPPRRGLFSWLNEGLSEL